MNIKTKVISSIRWLFIAQLFSQIVRTGVTIYVIRELESEHMAFVALSQTIIGFLELFSSLGLGAAIISRSDLTRRDLSNIKGMILTINLFLGALAFIFSNSFAQFYNTPELAPILRLFSLGFVFTALSSVQSALLIKEMRFKEISLIQVLASLAGAATSYLLVTNGYLYWSIVCGGIVYMGVRSLLINIVSGVIILPRFSIKESASHLAFGGFVTLNGIAWYLYTTLDIIIAGRFWEPETLGVYAVAVQLTIIPLTKFAPMLKQVAFPAYSLALVEDASKLEYYLSRSLTISMSVALPVYFGISCTAFILIPTLLGDEWTGAALPLLYLCLSAPFRFMLEMLSPAMIACRKPNIAFYNSLVILIVMLSGFVLVSAFTEKPAYLALVWMLLFPMLSIVVARNYCSAMKVSTVRVLKGVLAPFIFSVIMWLIVFGFYLFFREQLNGFYLLVCSIMLGVFVYCVSVMVAGRHLLKIYRGLLKRDKAILGAA